MSKDMSFRRPVLIMHALMPEFFLNKNYMDLSVFDSLVSLFKDLSVFCLKMLS